MPDPKTQEAVELMLNFAERTGLTSQRSPQRYLWTDAFAVCNFLELARATGKERYRNLALQLVDQVHHTLGQFRPDDTRSGWISGLQEQKGESHPTRGGLRIGKKLPERQPDEIFDEQLEWERDGQYFHYLAKWMHALDQVARSTGLPQYNQWARELAETAYNAFTFSPSTTGTPRRMHWKMSIDLQRALVPSMGQHDPLDAYITDVQLITTVSSLSGSHREPALASETKQLAIMIKDREWTTADPLGIGGLLTDAYRVIQLTQHGAVMVDKLIEALLSAALAGLQYYAHSGELRQPAEYRLAFRELGLAIGLYAAERMWEAIDSTNNQPAVSKSVYAQLTSLLSYKSLRGNIENFWRDPVHHHVKLWTEHRDINEVMLATSLKPDGFLVLLPPG